MISEYEPSVDTKRSSGVDNPDERDQPHLLEREGPEMFLERGSHGGQSVWLYMGNEQSVDASAIVEVEKSNVLQVEQQEVNNVHSLNRFLLLSVAESSYTSFVFHVRVFKDSLVTGSRKFLEL